MNAVTIDVSTGARAWQQAPVVAPWKIDTGRGTSSGRVSSEWYRRPADQRFVSLEDLETHCFGVANSGDVQTTNVADIRVIADHNKQESIHLALPNGAVVRPNHWSFGQLCQLTKAPASYLRELPGELAAINLQWGVANYQGELLKSYYTKDGEQELRAVTSPTYGRIFDHRLVQAVRKLAGNGTGDTRWKIPGVIDWSTMKYNPDAPITSQSTTLFASDRDVFLFLVDDKNPIEIGKLPNGDPDYVFRGFYAWNSEVGARSFGIACFYLRGVCQNRCLWGLEGYEELSFRHTSNAPERFVTQAGQALETFANARTDRVIEGVRQAKALTLAKSDDDALSFLKSIKMPEKTARDVIQTVMNEEGRPARSAWDIVQGITAVARREEHQDERLALERVAGRILNKVKAA